jgi:phosphoribosylanthranilate isomerase
VVLAGGLSPKNVYEGMMSVRPFGADSCTRTNAEGRDAKPVRFKKDYQKVKAFVAEVRRAERDLFHCRTP